MKLKAIVATLDGIDAKYHEAYTKRADGKFVLEVESSDGYALEDVSALRTALSRERENVTNATNRLAVFGDLDPVKARESIAKVAEMVNWTPTQKVQEQLDAAKAQYESKSKTEVEAERKKTEKATGKLRKLLVDNSAIAAIAKHGGNGTLLLPHVVSRLQMRNNAETDEDYVVVLNEKGHATLSMRAGASDNMTVDEFVESLKSDPVFQPAFAGSKQSGGGSEGSGGDGGSGGGRTISKSNLTRPGKNLEDIATGKVTVED